MAPLPSIVADKEVPLPDPSREPILSAEYLEMN